jgi:drug/metabolite transporter (DMT)-like permease
MQKIKERLKPFAGAICVFFGAVFFSGKAILVKIGIHEGASVLTLLNLRMLISLPFFVLMAFYQNNQPQYKLSYKDYVTIFFLGVSGYYLASYFDFEGLKYISASLERLIVFIYPTLVVLISALVFKTKIELKEILSILLTYIGVVIAFVADVPVMSSEVIKGSLFVFASAFTYAIYLVGSGQMIPKIGAARFTGFAMIVSTFSVLIHSWIMDDFNIVTTWKIYGIGAMMAILCTVIPAILIAMGIKLIGSGKASIIGSIGPVSTIGLAVIFLNETITIYQLFGTAIVIAGVLLVSKQKQTTKPIINAKQL